MRRVVPLITIVFLLVPMATAAQVSEKGSGLTAGSIAFTFTYNEQDQGPTIVKGVKQNDVIRIIYGRTNTGLDVKREYFFKSRIGEKWYYEILKGEKGLSISTGEHVDVDLDKDSEAELVMEFTKLDRNEGTFTFYNPATLVAKNKENETKNESVTNETIVEPNEEEVVTEEPEVNLTPSKEFQEKLPTTPPENSLPARSLTPVLIAVLLILILGAGLYFLVKKGLPSGGGSVKKDAPAARAGELIEEKVAKRARPDEKAVKKELARKKAEKDKRQKQRDESPKKEEAAPYHIAPHQGKYKIVSRGPRIRKR